MAEKRSSSRFRKRARSAIFRIYGLCVTRKRTEERIQQLEDILAPGNCEIYEVKDHYDKVELGCTVTVEDVDTDRRQTLQIVGIYESDPNTEPKKISNESPLGKALMGAEKDDEVDFEHKNNIVTYRIVDIK